MRIRLPGNYLPLSGGTLTGLLTLQAGLSLYNQNISNVADLIATSFISKIDGSRIEAKNTDANVLVMKARDSGVGSVIVAQLVGAADPYFQATLPMVLSPSTWPGTPVEGHFGYLAADDQLYYQDASGKRALLSDASLNLCKAVKVRVKHDDTSPVTLITMPAGSIVLHVMLNVVEAFTGTGSILEIGDAADADGFWKLDYVPLGSTGFKLLTGATIGAYLYNATEKFLVKSYNAATAVRATITITDSVVGEVDVYLIYISLG